MANAQRISKLIVGAIISAAIHVDALAEKALRKAWLSYALILLIQSKVIWRIWDIKDITSGDTSSYFGTAKKWADGFLVDIVWSPLYTAFYGSLLFVTADTYNVTIMHRVVIVLAAAVGVLFVMRQLLPPNLALLGAAWWAILPINYNTLYEVHLFAVLPILLVWALVLGKDAAWARGAGLATLATCAVLVRNEFLVAAIAMLLLSTFYEWRCSRKEAHCAVAYGIPLVSGVTLCGLAYWRSFIKLPEIWPHLEMKHTLNMCQVYAFGYQQRHPEWTASPWTECQTLANSTFGVDYPSIGHMLWSNPMAMFAHFWWNLRLVPNGLEVLLFNARAGSFEPDYPPTRLATYPLILGVLVIVSLAAGVILAWRARSKAPLFWICNRTAIAFLPLLTMAVPVVLTQRPRPSYFFYVSIIIIAATMNAIRLILRRWPGIRRILNIGALAAASALILLMPRYSLPPYLPSGRPILQKLEHLAPHRTVLLKAQGRIILGNWASDILNYLDLNLSAGNPFEGSQVVFGNDLLRRWEGTTPLEEFLAEQRVHVLYLDASELAWLRTQQQAKPMLDNPRGTGWLDLAHEDRGAGSWALLTKM
ncbi:MAG TPA: hypothetical protein VLJ17_03190 [Xanthobacteraceae bacterium]|nr:hypothetical protein [Xanthobacteraceae bacterium]